MYQKILLKWMALESFLPDAYPSKVKAYYSKCGRAIAKLGDFELSTNLLVSIQITLTDAC